MTLTPDDPSEEGGSHPFSNVTLPENRWLPSLVMIGCKLRDFRLCCFRNRRDVPGHHTPYTAGIGGVSSDLPETSSGFSAAF